MLRSWVKFILTTPHPAARAAIPAASVPTVPGQVRYPPTDHGLAFMRPADIVAANQDLVGRLRLHAAAPAGIFEQRFLGPIVRLADQVNVMPASASGLFAGEMGLIRAALECAFFSYQSSDGRIFTGAASVERRHALEGRWRYLCFLAGLIYPVGKTLDRVAVTTAGGESWPRHHAGLWEWAQSKSVDRLYFSWPQAAADEDEPGPSNTGLVLLPKVIAAENLQYLQDGSADLVTSLYQLVVGAPTSARIAKEVLEGAWARIVRREAARRPQAFGRAVAGSHIGPYLVGAVRALIEKGEWKPNDSPLKADADGLYMEWPSAGDALVRYGQQQGYAGWPKDAATLAELLIAANVVEARTSDMGFVEVIDSEGEILQALKIANPLAVLEDFDGDDYPAPKRLDAVLRADPLRNADVADAPPSIDAAAVILGSAPQTTEEPAHKPAAAPATQADPSAESAPAEPAPPKLAAPEHHDEAPSTRISEPPPVSFSDLVPDEVRKDIGQGMNAELLGKVIQLWRRRDKNLCRRTENGAAIAFSALVQIVRDPAKWADSMAAAGLIYSPPNTPGLRMMKIAIPEGGKKVEAIVLSERACRKLGL
jgi:conjugal transfer pilus assembly protein TraI